MRDFWAGLRAIIAKDIVVELRARQVLPTMVVLGMLIVFILRMVSEAGPAGPGTAVMGAAALWIAFLFSGLLAQERSFAAEQQNGCIDGLLMAPLDAGTIYLAKLLANVIVLSIFEVIVVPIVVVAFNLHVPRGWLWLVVVLLLGNLAISSVGTLFSAAVQLSQDPRRPAEHCRPGDPDAGDDSRVVRTAGSVRGDARGGGRLRFARLRRQLQGGRGVHDRI